MIIVSQGWWNIMIRIHACGIDMKMHLMVKPQVLNLNEVVVTGIGTKRKQISKNRSKIYCW